MIRTVRFTIVAQLFALVLLIQAPVAVKAQSKGDERAIRGVMQRFEDLWNKHDVDSFAELFAPDAEFTNPRGATRSGRVAIKDFHKFESRIQVANVRVKFYAKNVATVDCEHTLGPYDNGTVIKTAPLFILKKVKGQWLIAVLHVAFIEVPSKT